MKSYLISDCVRSTSDALEGVDNVEGVDSIPIPNASKCFTGQFIGA